MAKRSVEAAKTRFPSLGVFVSAVAALCLCLLLMLSLGVRVAMHWLPEIAHLLEERIEQQLSVELEVGHIRGEVKGFSPTIYLQELQLVPSDKGVSPFVVEAADITIDLWRSIWRRNLQLRKLKLRGASLHLVVDEQGNVRLRGQGDSTQPTALSAEQSRSLLELAYDQQNVVLEKIQLRFDFPEQPSIESDDARFVLIKQGGKRLLGLDFKASNHALSFSTRLHLNHKAYAFNELAGVVYLALDGERLERWLPEQWPLDLVPARIGGKVELWGKLQKGGLAESTLVLSQAQISVVHRQQSGLWSLDDAAVVARGNRTASGYALQLESIVGHNDEAGRLNAGPLWLDVKEDESQSVKWQMRGENISLSGLARHIKAWPFPLPEPAPRVLDAAPEGRISEFYLLGENYQWHRASVRFQDVAVGTDEEVAKLSGVYGWISATPQEGVAFIEPQPIRLGLPNLFKQELSGEVQGSLHWHKESEGYAVTSSRLQVLNQDAMGEALLALYLPQNAPPYLKLRAEVAQGRVSRAATYIPLRKIPEAASQWLEQAFVGGELERGRFLYEGTVKPAIEMPWQRTFLMSFATQSAELHLAPGWPNMRQINGEVQINGAEVTGESLSAHYLGQSLRQIQLHISPQPERNRLVASGFFDGEAEALNRLFTQTPLVAQVPEALQQWQVQGGTASGQLMLAIPLAPKAEKLALEVNAHLSQVAFGSESLDLFATQLTGDAVFSLEKGLQVSKFTGRLFERDITGRITSSENHTQLSLVGDVAMKQLRQWQSMDWMKHLWGQMEYQFSLNIPRQAEHAVSWQVYSDLQGVGVDLPAPLHKASKDKLPLTLSWHPSHRGQRFALRSQLLQGEMQLNNEGLERGVVHFGGGKAVLPSQGIAITGKVAQLDVLEWQQLFADSDNALASSQWPTTQLALAAEELSLGGLGQVGTGDIAFTQEERAWQLQMQSERLSGELWVPNQYQPRGDRPLTAHVDKLIWPFKTKALSASTLPFKATPTTFPVADVRINELQVKGKALGRWQAQLRPMANGILFEALQGRWHGTTLMGQLRWQEHKAQQTSELEATIDSQDLGTLFRELGLASFIEGEQASSQWEVAWQGAPWELDYQQLEGDVSLRVDRAFLPTSDKRTSALRMLGVLNVGHTLGRRLRLDFSDVVQKGLVVDKLTGDYRLKGSKVITTNAQILSPSAEFKIAGVLDMATGELDSGIEVTLPLSSNLYAGCFAGPATCAGIFVVERLWGNRLEKMTSMEYQVRGGWKNPRVEDVSGIYTKKRQQYAY